MWLFRRKGAEDPSSSSKPLDPPRSPNFRAPWRNISWGQKEIDLDYAKEYQPKDKAKHLKILLFGPVGAGKSSFINSVSSILRGKLVIPTACSATTSDTSFTKNFDTYKILREDGSEKTFYHFVFSDTMGLEGGAGKGVAVEDIKLIMKGNVKTGFQFHTDPVSERDPAYNPDPSPDDKAHVLVCVLSANSVEIKSPIVQKIKIIREAARDLGVPQIAVLTKIDEACGETEKDLTNVYKSKHLKKKMTDFSSATGFPMNCIFPVKNYSDEIEINNDIDTLILSALRRMIDFGEDFINAL